MKQHLYKIFAPVVAKITWRPHSTFLKLKAKIRSEAINFNQGTHLGGARKIIYEAK